MATATENTYGLLSPIGLHGSPGPLTTWEPKRYHKGGAIKVKPSWQYFSFCDTGKYIRLAVHYYKDGGIQTGATTVWNNGEQNVTKSFSRQTGGTGSPWTTDFPAGWFGLVGRTYASNCGGVAAGHDHNGSGIAGKSDLLVNMAITYNK